MFKKKKKTTPEEIAAAPVNETNAEQPKEFQKNIKTLWIYTSLFCVFALVLIFISSFFQEKRDRENETLRAQVEKHELEFSDNQSTIKNIESELDTYKQINDILDKRNDYLEEQYGIDKDLLMSSAEMLANADYIMAAMTALDAGDKVAAAQSIACVDVNYLTDTMLECYNKCVGELARE